MRVTNRMLNNNVIRNINRNLENMARTQEQMSSGKRVNRPSDDPIVVARVLAFKTSIAANDQYKKNMEDAKGWLDASESVLGMATDVLQRARELAVYGSNGTMPPESMDALGKEVDQLLDEMMQVANTSYGGRYIFGGSQTTATPFVSNSSSTDDPVEYNGDSAALNWEIAPGVTISVNENGDQIFMQAINNGSATESIFKLLNDLSAALHGGTATDVSATLNKFDQAIDHILNIRATLGAKSNRMEMAMSRLEDTQIGLTQTMSKLEDIDLAETVMNYKTQENVYLASLSTGAKVLQPSLIDYLR
ncbi:flagellar hook-associated protein FlgL [Moorella thermoacetica]|uniref:Flagellin-like protein n=1 Tax=Moorella thermoacetica (strain ATCC 39073 / JCM 9320) TaxID=264732 RepID=Q2RKH4_MOOTA|nr:flagellar hook-associated protein FlgL [Moorella thermoacetica]AKX93493.1 flagellar hook-associated protein 3 [Moorella thermoacetica]AKX96140.1 flagellar hook-associated protein 3 [Moorella thermoacetica]OIQ55352.1 flagellar hook-associated protein 3 [Moorella thermoacetica]QCZ99950.1 Flagellar hook-associated protein 3 [Moorella thermoacetica]TYL07396.1 Flagellar hook-associated protein 3 [Moorella thermoacetica]